MAIRGAAPLGERCHALRVGLESAVEGPPRLPRRSPATTDVRATVQLRHREIFQGRPWQTAAMGPLGPTFRPTAPAVGLTAVGLCDGTTTSGAIDSKAAVSI